MTRSSRLANPASLDATEVLPSTHAPAWAWGICWLMFASTVLNYMDRQAIALVGPRIRQEFHLSNAGYGWVLAAFYLTYALFQVPAGYLADRAGARRTYAAAVVLWSFAGIATAFVPAQALGILLACRAMLGVGESFNWPCALRCTAAVLPPADRSLGNGIFNSGAAIGAVVTPWTVPLIASAYGWRTAFVVIGVLGFVWVVAWRQVLAGKRGELVDLGMTKPQSPAELDEPTTRLEPRARLAFQILAVTAIAMGCSALWLGAMAVWWAICLVIFGSLAVAAALPLKSLGGSTWARSLGEVARLPRFWVLAVVSVSVNVSWHFLVNWTGIFFQEGRRLGLVAGGMVSALPFLASGLGNLGGGAASRMLAIRGLRPAQARLTVLVIGALLISVGTAVGAVQSNPVIVLLISIMALGTAAYMANYFAFCQEVSSRYTGLIVGILGAMGNLFAGGFLFVAGGIVDRTGSYGLNFVIVGVLPLIGVAALALGWRTGAEDQASA
jgi:ACS family hexuronate transporter-like MFS transporter